MKLTTKFFTLATISFGFAVAPSSFGQILFQDNFDSGESFFNWTSRTSASDAFVDFAFDYSTLGIPAAPNSTTTTIGMRFLVNQSAAEFQGISATPIGQAFTGDFKIEFDMWINYVGPLPAGGSGSTQMATFGWGTNGNTTQWASANHSILFAGSGDGGSAQDYRVYRAAGGAPMAPDTGVYAAGASTSPDARNNTHPYYSSLGGHAAPARQLELYPEQTGTTSAGTLGMTWHEVTVEKSGDNLTWHVGQLLIASVSIEGVILGGENIVFGMFDINASSSTSANDFLNAAIFDNVRVSEIPEPSAFLLSAFAATALLSRRRRARE